VSGGGITVYSETFGEQFVGKYAWLRQAIHPLPNFNLNVTIVNKGEQVFLCDDFVWDDSDVEPHNTCIDPTVC
jgi:hypothetical protein